MEGELVGRIASKSLTAKQVETEKREGYYADGACTGLNLQVIWHSPKSVDTFHSAV